MPRPEPTPRIADTLFMNPDVRAAIITELIATHDGTDYPIPTVGDVIQDTLNAVARELDEEADSLADCNKVDTCTAQAIVLRRLAALLRGES